MVLNVEPAGEIDLNVEVQGDVIPQFDLNMEPPALEYAFDLNMEPPAGDVIADNDNVNDNALHGGIEVNVEPPVQARNGWKDVPNEIRKLIFQTLLARSTNGKLKRHVTKEVSVQFGVGIQCVQRIWKKGAGGKVHLLLFQQERCTMWDPP
ncbi:hypothetical protein U9M48_030490 [Paspalum notatum var. saurae]|uniref:DUF7769 domain-containing protein n=1 Tax=Paspalum notatum var. saurae TaxID=547442 RepID=A0AAQ3U1I5_PASNO